jgi:DNA primase
MLPDLIRQWLPSGERRGDLYFALNPRRTDSNLGSFQIDTVTGRWRDHAIGVGGSHAISLYAYLFTGGDYHNAVKALASDPAVRAAIATGVAPPPAKVANLLNSRTDQIATARRLYAEAVGLSGMPAATYLHNRGLRPTEAWDTLRASVQHYPGVGACPALIAPIEDLDGILVGLHRIYLTPTGAKLDVPRPKRGLGEMRGHAIRLGEATDELMICEGLEDGLTLFQVFGIPVWVACGVGFMKAMAIPHSVRSLIIAADNDGPGKTGAQEAADVQNVGGRCVSIMRPSPGFADFNDELRGIRHGE